MLCLFEDNLTDWSPPDTINALFHKPEGELCPWQFEHFTAVQLRSVTNGKSKY